MGQSKNGFKLVEQSSKERPEWTKAAAPQVISSYRQWVPSHTKMLKRGFELFAE